MARLFAFELVFIDVHNMVCPGQHIALEVHFAYLEL
jgi:hypothetical protein